MATERQPAEGPPLARDPGAPPHGGLLAAQRLRAHGVTKLFTLSGGHLFSIYDGCREVGIDIVDVRHEQPAVRGRLGVAGERRSLGVLALGRHARRAYPMAGGR